MRLRFTPISETEALIFYVCGGSFVTTLIYLFLPKYFNYRFKNYYNRYLRDYERMCENEVADELIEEINSTPVTK